MKNKSISAVAKVVKNLDQRIRDYRTRERHAENASRALQKVERGRGRKLSISSKKAADQYALKVLGSKEYALWLYVYAVIQDEFREGWIPRNFYQERVLPKINGGIREVTNLKSLTATFLGNESIPDIGYWIDGLFYDRERRPCSFFDLKKYITDLGSEVFVKSDRSYRGQGIFRGNGDSIKEELFKSMGNCVIQKGIQHHRFFDEIIAGSPATLRVMTTKEKDGSINARGSYVRLGRSNTVWVESDNSIKVAVVSPDGQLSPYGYSQDWNEYKAHPDTSSEFSGKKVPGYEQAVELCKRMHGRVPHLSVVGWDIVIDDDGKASIIEWNGRHPAIEFIEGTNGPCFIGLNWERFHA